MPKPTPEPKPFVVEPMYHASEAAGEIRLRITGIRVDRSFRQMEDIATLLEAILNAVELGKRDAY